MAQGGLTESNNYGASCCLLLTSTLAPTLTLSLSLTVIERKNGSVEAWGEYKYEPGDPTDDSKAEGGGDAGGTAVAVLLAEMENLTELTRAATQTGVGGFKWVGICMRACTHVVS